jgi:RNA polymerase sigma factor (sigma-70 family)
VPPFSLDTALAGKLYERAGAGRWNLALERFVEALEASAAKAFAGRAASRREVEGYVASLRLEDLALACACADGIETAWDHFVLEFRPILYRAADGIDPAGGAREFADSLYADLFGIRAAGGERQSLFRYFHGRSTLATWLRAVLAQRYVDSVRANRRMAPMPVEEPAAHAAPFTDPHRDRYRALMEAALGRALAALDSRDRLRLGYYYAQGLTLAETGRLLREHEATVSRQLARTRSAIRRDVERQLREAALSAAQIEECFACVAEDAGSFDLNRELGAAPARNREPIVLQEKVKQ